MGASIVYKQRENRTKKKEENRTKISSLTWLLPHKVFNDFHSLNLKTWSGVPRCVKSKNGNKVIAEEEEEEPNK